MISEEEMMEFDEEIKAVPEEAWPKSFTPFPPIYTILIPVFHPPNLHI